MYRVYIRDSQLNRIGEITNFTKLELVPRFNAVGSFVLDIPTDTFAAKELIKPKYGIIVKKDGQTVMSGTVIIRQRYFSNGGGDHIVFSGKDDNVYLEQRLAYPEINGNFALQSHDVRTGNAETIMKQYVDYNCGLNALPERQLLTIEPNKGLGTIVTGRARFDKLIELLSSLALNGGGLGFNVVQEGSELVFKVFQPTDKSKSAFFSPLLGNLSNFDYKNDNPTANFILVGGGGEGQDRIIRQNSDNSSVAKFGRIEAFKDQRNTTDETELTQSLEEELTNGAEQHFFNFIPVDTPQLSFGKHYNLGDKVSVVLTQPNERVDIETLYYFISAYQTVPMQSERVTKIQEKLDVIQDIVREVKITIDSNGETIAPVVGTEETNRSSILGIFDKQRKLEKRLSNLERM